MAAQNPSLTNLNLEKRMILESRMSPGAANNVISVDSTFGKVSNNFTTNIVREETPLSELSNSNLKSPSKSNSNKPLESPKEMVQSPPMANPFQNINRNKPQEIIVIGSAENSNSRSNSGKENNSMLNLNEKRRREEMGIIDANFLSLENDSQDGQQSQSQPGRPSKSKKLSFEDNDNNGQNDGSRGAPTKPSKPITAYFAQTGVIHSSYPQQTSGSEPQPQQIFHSITNSSSISLSDLTSSKPSNTSTKSSSKAIEKQQATAAANNSQQQTAVTNELKKQLDQMKIAKEQIESKVVRYETEIKSYSDRLKQNEDRNTKLVKALEDVYRTTALQEFRRKRDQLALNCVRLGKISTLRTSTTTIGDVWEEGYALKDISRRTAEFIERKEDLEARKKKINNMKRAAKKDSNNMEVEWEMDLEFERSTEQEAIRAHLEQLKKDEIALNEERRMLETEKAIHQKELKRCQCEERSRFYRDLPTLNGRYLLQQMLGRGGFSEVWKAFDLVDIREVAVKIHQLNPTWSEERKSSYIKHVTREYTIHRDMKHPRVVQLFDVFEIDVNSFATVLEYCKGIDLDEKLKRSRILPEKDARAIFMQIMSGLRYLNRPLSYGPNGELLLPESQDNTNASSANNVNGSGNVTSSTTSNKAKKVSIIHFDLKPANILFDENDDVKITDFGLSKVIDESTEGTSMELTSQGAGTYWYLPPECFAKGPNPPRISSKVDVWSAGVIFYQMLYGTRPFGEGKTQENIWSENIIYKADTVEFPSDTKAQKVSDEAKEIIRACLTRDQNHRPDVLTVCQSPYFRNK